jgi:hypothetical protein
MEDSTVKMLDAVALTEALPERGLRRGQVGAVVDELEPGVFEIEFVDRNGHTYQMLPLRAEQLLVLRYENTTTA